MQPISSTNLLGFTVLWPFTYSFSDTFSIICLRPDLYWSWGTTIIWLPTNLFKNRFPSQPISVVCMKKKKDQMKVSISLLTFTEFRHLCKAKLVPLVSEMSNIRVKIELLLAAYYAVFPVCFKSQRNVLNYNMWQCSRESSHLIFVWVHYSMQCEELLFHKQIPSLQIRKKQRL